MPPRTRRPLECPPPPLAGDGVGTVAMRALGRPLGLVARRPGTLLRHRLLPPCGLARCCSSATTGAVPTRADPAIVSSSTAPGPIVVDSASGVVPGRPVVVADSAAGATPAAGTPSFQAEPCLTSPSLAPLPLTPSPPPPSPPHAHHHSPSPPLPPPPPARPAGGETGAGLATVPIPPELAVVPVPTTPELAVVPVPMGPALPEGGVAQLPVDHIPGWFFATNGYFSLPMKGLENFFALVHDVTGAPW